MTRTRNLVAAALVFAFGGGVAFAAGQSASPKPQREAMEAAAAYQRAMTLVRQGAFQEAEKEFRTAEKKTGEKNLEYVIAAAENYIELHRPDEARKRFERIYKQDPANTRALVGLAAAYEEAQNYRDALRMWQRYAAMDLAPSERKEALATAGEAQTLFLERYDATEKLAGGAAAPPQNEREWGLGVARDLAATGVPLVKDAAVTAYVEGLCRTLAARAKGIPAGDQVLVLDSPAIHAFTAPGFVFVFRGLLDVVGSEAALAGVLAHQMGHAAARHVTAGLSRQASNQQQLEKYRQSTTAWARFMTKMLEAGNPYGEPAYTRDQEKHADRVGAHIAYDAGFDPAGIGQVLDVYESLPYSSRHAWETMARAHPFWKDRAVALSEHTALFPARPPKASSPAFQKMKARLAELPPPQEPAVPIPQTANVGFSTPQPASAPPRPGAAAAGTDGIPYTLDNAPFAGAIPVGWTARKTEAGTIVFEGEKGTPAYEATVELQVAPKSQFAGLTLDDMTARVVQNLGKNERAEVHDPVADRTGDGRPVRRVEAYYSMKDGRGRLVPVRHVSGVVEYPGWYAVVSYFAPTGSFERFLTEVDFIGDHLRYTAK